MKGTPNKSTAEYREKVSELFSDTLTQVRAKKDIENLSPNQRVKLLIDLLSYICPKPQEDVVDMNTTIVKINEFVQKSIGG